MERSVNINFNDPNNITGIGRLVNKENTKPGIDLDKIEREYISGKSGSSSTPADTSTNHEENSMQYYDNELKNLSRDIGIDLFDTNGDDRRHGGNKNNSSSSESDSDSAASGSGSGSESGSDGESGSGSGSESGSGSGSGSDSAASGSSRSSRGKNKDKSHKKSGGYNDYISGDRSHVSPSTAAHMSRNYTSYTEDQKKQMQINNVMEQISGQHTTNSDIFNIQSEKRSEWRSTIVSEIIELKEVLENEGEDMSKIPQSFDNIQDEQLNTIRNTLRYKQRRKMDCELFETVCTAGAYALEEICNGERAIPYTNIKPDLVDWHHTVQRKLHRHPYENAELVAHISNEYGISYGSRLLIEYGFSAILHHKARQGEKIKTRTSVGQTEVRNAMHDIYKQNN